MSNLTFSKLKSVIERHQNKFKPSSLVAIYLIGSYATKTYKNSMSDLDLVLIHYSKNFNEYKNIFNFSTMLHSKLKKLGFRVVDIFVIHFLSFNKLLLLNPIYLSPFFTHYGCTLILKNKKKNIKKININPLKICNDYLFSITEEELNRMWHEMPNPDSASRRRNLKYFYWFLMHLVFIRSRKIVTFYDLDSFFLKYKFKTFSRNKDFIQLIKKIINYIKNDYNLPWGEIMRLEADILKNSNFLYDEFRIYYNSLKYKNRELFKALRDLSKLMLIEIKDKISYSDKGIKEKEIEAWFRKSFSTLLKISIFTGLKKLLKFDESTPSIVKKSLNYLVSKYLKSIPRKSAKRYFLKYPMTSYLARISIILDYTISQIPSRIIYKNEKD